MILAPSVYEHGSAEALRPRLVPVPVHPVPMRESSGRVCKVHPILSSPKYPNGGAAEHLEIALALNRHLSEGAEGRTRRRRRVLLFAFYAF